MRRDWAPSANVGSGKRKLGRLGVAFAPLPQLRMEIQWPCL